MQKRIIDPPQNEWQHLLTPPTPNELTIYNLFHDNPGFSPDWEMYIKPHLNGLRPDLVFLNPYVGIGVFAIKDWDLNTLRDAIRCQTVRNPLNELRLYKDEIFHLYCPRLNASSGQAVITAGLIFPQIPQTEINRLLDPRRDGHMRQHKPRYPFSGSEQVNTGNIDALFPEHRNWGRHNKSRRMSEDTAKDLRGWLKEPAFSREQREPLPLNERQWVIATEPPPTRYRKVKGPAGSGKSQALAARAAVLTSENKRVLVCSFNITLMHYLRDLVARHIREVAEKQNRHPNIRQQVEFRHFHGWCKWICTVAGYQDRYRQLWHQHNTEERLHMENRIDTEQKRVLEYNMAKLVEEIYDNPTIKNDLPTYDAILIDEGQDYNLVWWQTLRKAVEPDGQPREMLLVADKTQNIYGTNVTWLDKPLSNTWLSGTWFELENSYRLPPELIPILKDFSNEFLIPSGGEADIPENAQGELDIDPKIEMRWVQVPPEDAVTETCFKEMNRQMKNLRDDTAITDIVFLTPRNDIGEAFVNKCKEKNLNVNHTFGEDDLSNQQNSAPRDRNFYKSEDSRRKKLAFFLGKPEVKATTLHSFKGWEGRHLILYVNRIASPEDCSLFYTAVSRLQRHPNGSMLTIISSCPELRDFGRRHFSRNFVDLANRGTE